MNSNIILMKTVMTTTMVIPKLLFYYINTLLTLLLLRLLLLLTLPPPLLLQCASILGGVGVRDPQILGRRLWGSQDDRGWAVKYYYILSCTQEVCSKVVSRGTWWRLG